MTGFSSKMPPDDPNMVKYVIYMSIRVHRIFIGTFGSNIESISQPRAPEVESGILFQNQFIHQVENSGTNNWLKWIVLSTWGKSPNR